MFYQFKNNKKGNLTVILLGLISVMLLMTMALSKRMSGHTRLLTLSDYTQISRYFLESYIGDVMQQMRAATNDSGSELSKMLYDNYEKIQEKGDLTGLFYEESNELKDLADDLNIASDKRHVEVVIIPVNDNDDTDTEENKLSLSYPDGIVVPEDKKAQEKKGLIKLTCDCTFKNRKYVLEVQYLFSSVYRLTPVLKDFVLFVDNIYDEQCEFKNNLNGQKRTKNIDSLNILSVKGGQVQKDNIPDFSDNRDFGRVDGPFRPMVLFPPLNEDYVFNLTSNDPNYTRLGQAKKNGMVYFGPSDTNNRNFEKNIYLNLSGSIPGQEDSDNIHLTIDKSLDYNELYLLNAKTLGLVNDKYIRDANIDIYNKNDGNLEQIWINLRNFNIQNISPYGVRIAMNSSQVSEFGLLGFCSEVPDFLNGPKWFLEDFLGSANDNQGSDNRNIFWNEVYNGRGDANSLKKFLTFSSGIKLLGLYSKIYEQQYQNGYIQLAPRQIFGNVFMRFFVLSLWWVPSGSGVPLKFNMNSEGVTVDQRLYNRWYSDDDTTETVTYSPKNPDIENNYGLIMSKVMSGLDAKDRYQKGEVDEDNKYKYLFMPYNTDYASDKERENGNRYRSYAGNAIYDESNFSPNDGFTLDIEKLKFHEFGDKWFATSDTNNNDEENKPSPIEQRIGRTFTGENAGEKFKKAVGYPEKFNINGVVYVGGDLDLSDDMNLSPENCSGGIVLVDGNITLSNIYRGNKEIDSSKFDKMGTHYNNWVTYEDKPDTEYIAPDKILTFVCLKEEGKPRKITIKGNTLLGVQLINLSNKETREDQIEWKVDDKSKEIVFYGSIVCDKLFLPNRLAEFGEITRGYDEDIAAPYFLYPPVMATETPPIAIQINENMKSYKLTSGLLEEQH